MIRALLLLVLLAAPARSDPAAEAEALAAAHGTAAVVATWGADGASAIAVAGAAHAGAAPAGPDDAWHVGSLTKAMTATLAARLVAADAVAWDATAGELLGAAAPWADVTLAELLHHRSGMAANLPRWRAAMRPDRAQYVAHMLATAPGTPRGETEYSNAGYVVAGAMLEVAGGAPWEELMRRHVFAPLGMTGAGFGAPKAIWGHGPAPVPPGPFADNLPAMGPAGTVHLPPAAMLRFLAAHAAEDPAFLSPAEWRRLHTPVGRYAMGWRPAGGGLAHYGTNTAWMAQMWIGDGRAVFVAVNAGGEAARLATEAAMLRLAGSPPRP